MGTLNKHFACTDIVRRLKIHGLVKEKDRDRKVTAIIEFFDDLYDNLEVSVIPQYHSENLIFHKGGVVYMVQESINGGWLWVSNKGNRSYPKESSELMSGVISILIMMMFRKYTNVKTIGQRVDKTVGAPITMTLEDQVVIETLLRSMPTI